MSSGNSHLEMLTQSQLHNLKCIDICCIPSKICVQFEFFQTFSRKHENIEFKQDGYRTLIIHNGTNTTHRSENDFVTVFCEHLKLVMSESPNFNKIVMKSDEKVTQHSEDEKAKLDAIVIAIFQQLANSLQPSKIRSLLTDSNNMNLLAQVLPSFRPMALHNVQLQFLNCDELMQFDQFLRMDVWQKLGTPFVIFWPNIISFEMISYLTKLHRLSFRIPRTRVEIPPINSTYAIDNNQFYEFEAIPLLFNPIPNRTTKFVKIEMIDDGIHFCPSNSEDLENEKKQHEAFSLEFNRRFPQCREVDDSIERAKLEFENIIPAWIIDESTMMIRVYNPDELRKRFHRLNRDETEYPEIPEWISESHKLNVLKVFGNALISDGILRMLEYADIESFRKVCYLFRESVNDFKREYKLKRFVIEFITTTEIRVISTIGSSNLDITYAGNKNQCFVGLTNQKLIEEDFRLRLLKDFEMCLTQQSCCMEELKIEFLYEKYLVDNIDNIDYDAVEISANKFLKVFENFSISKNLLLKTKRFTIGATNQEDVLRILRFTYPGYLLGIEINSPNGMEDQQLLEIDKIIQMEHWLCLDYLKITHLLAVSTPIQQIPFSQIEDGEITVTNLTLADLNYLTQEFKRGNVRKFKISFLNCEIADSVPFLDRWLPYRPATIRLPINIWYFPIPSSDNYLHVVYYVNRFVEFKSCNSDETPENVCVFIDVMDDLMDALVDHLLTDLLLDDFDVMANVNAMGSNMSIVNTTECLICSNEYDKECRKPCIGTCGHSICEICKHKMVSSKCPQCNREEAFAITTINYQLLRLIKHFNSLKTGESSSQVSLLDNAKGLKEGICCECTLRSRNLRLCITCAVKADVLRLDDNKKEFVLNVENNDVEDFLQRAKRIAICEDCALTSIPHEDHKTMQLASLKNILEDWVPSKSTSMFAISDPVLVADRNPREPLLIGIFHPVDNVWTPVGRMPDPKSNYAVVHNKSQIFIVGGMNNGTWLQTMEMYDRDKNLRRDCQHMKRGRTRTSAGFHNSKLYVAGGHDGTYMNSVEVFDPKHDDWKDGPTLQKSRADAAVVSCSGELFVLGGFNGKEYEEKIERMNETTQTFEIFGEMQGSRAGFAACAFRGRIYIAGGWSNSNNTLRSVRSFDPMTKSWRDEASLNKDRKYFTLHATSKTIYAIRGCADSWSLINEVERFDPDNGKWDIISCSSGPAQQMNPNENG